MEKETLSEVSRKLNVLIALSIKDLNGEKDFDKKGRKQGAGELARYLNNMGLEAKDIADIIGAPLQSIRTLLTPKRRK